MKHKTPDCDGRLIDISTLLQPKTVMCTKCRATGPTPIEPPSSQGAQDDMTPERFMELMGEAEKEDRVLTQELQVVRILAVSAIIVAFLALATAILR